MGGAAALQRLHQHVDAALRRDDARGQALDRYLGHLIVIGVVVRIIIIVIGGRRLDRDAAFLLRAVRLLLRAAGVVVEGAVLGVEGQVPNGRWVKGGILKIDICFVIRSTCRIIVFEGTRGPLFATAVTAIFAVFIIVVFVVLELASVDEHAAALGLCEAHVHNRVVPSLQGPANGGVNR